MIDDEDVIPFEGEPEESQDDYYRRLHKRVEALAAQNPDAVIQAYEDAIRLIKDANKALSDATLEREAATRALNLVLERTGFVDRHGNPTATYKGHRYTITKEHPVGVRDKGLFLSWVREHMPKLLKEDYNANTVKGMLRKMKDEDLPPGVVRSDFEILKVSRRKQ